MTKTFTTDLRVGETLKIGDAAVTVGDKSGRMVRLHIAAPGAVKLAKEAAARRAPPAPGASGGQVMSTAMLYNGALGFMANMPKDAALEVLLTDAQYTPAPMHETPDDIPRCAIVSAAAGTAKHAVVCVTAAGATRLLMAATHQPGAQECASSPPWGIKEQAHGQYAIRLLPPALPGSAD